MFKSISLCVAGILGICAGSSLVQATTYRIDYTLSTGTGSYLFDTTRLVDTTPTQVDHTQYLELTDGAGIATFNQVSTSGVMLSLFNNYPWNTLTDNDGFSVSDLTLSHMILALGPTTIVNSATPSDLFTTLNSYNLMSDTTGGTPWTPGLPLLSYSIAVVPEPASLGLMTTATLLLLRRRIR